jgi:hypothetical protein
MNKAVAGKGDANLFATVTGARQDKVGHRANYIAGEERI